MPSYTFFLFFPALTHSLIHQFSLPPSHMRSLLRSLYLPSSIPYRFRSLRCVLSSSISYAFSLSSSIAYAFSLTFPLLTIFYTYCSRSSHCVLSSSISYAFSLSSSIAYAFFLTFPLLTIGYTYRSRSSHCVLCYGTRDAIIS